MTDDASIREAGAQAALAMIAHIAEIFGEEAMADFCKGVLEASAAALACHATPDESSTYCIGVGIGVGAAGRQRREAAH